MTPQERLAEVLSALEAINLHPLVMGGHAVRYYGLERMTDDFDMQLAPDGFDNLSERLEQSTWFRARKSVEVPSWRKDAFRRFQIGTLPNGREEWLEFWKENHLLPSFADAYQRRESGLYGGRTCDFLSLPDLIRAKETEREKDWLDIQYLEEFYDARLFAAAQTADLPLVSALARLRSRRGLETHLRAGNLSDATTVTAAMAGAANPIAISLLLPFVEQVSLPGGVLEPAIENRLRRVRPASPLHLTLVEAVRRRYKHDAMEADKADKEAVQRRVNMPTQ